MKINFRRLFGKKNSLQDIYPESSFTASIAFKNNYPLFIYLGENRVYAYTTRFMIKSSDVVKLFEVIEKSFHKKIESDNEIVSFGTKTLHYYQFSEFGQIVVDIITNDNKLIHDIFTMGLEPPSPDVVFPDRDFESFGSLQGDMEAWWNLYWYPFWGRLSSGEKEHYIERENISEELKEFIFLHD